MVTILAVVVKLHNTVKFHLTGEFWIMLLLSMSDYS